MRSTSQEARQRFLAAAGLALVLWSVCFGATPSETSAVRNDSVSIADLNRCKSSEPAPQSGTAAWVEADRLNVWCTELGKKLVDTNEARVAAHKPLEVARPLYRDDPFREPRSRWSGKRGRFSTGNYTRRDGSVGDYEIYAPLTGVGPFPAVLIPCYHCVKGIEDSVWHWMPESLAEAGYIVLMINTSSPSYDMMDATKDDFDVVFRNAEDALDFLLATPQTPTGRKEFLPLHALVDRRHVGVAGHSGNGLTAYHLGNDSRVRAIVSQDVADIFPPPGFKIRMTLYKNKPALKPTLIELAEYDGAVAPQLVKPTAVPTSKHGAFDRLAAGGADTMRIVNRSSTHSDWTGAVVVTRAARDAMSAEYAQMPLGAQPHGPYGELIASYFMLAWFDRYLKGPDNPAIAADALRRLTAEYFDQSADVHSISTGSYDAKLAGSGDSLSGNIPLTIAGTPVAALLSHMYDSSYHLEGGKLSCARMREGCAKR